MNFKTLLLILTVVLGISAQAQDRTVVATVDSAPIYLDEIGGAHTPEEGEIKFVDPDTTTAGTDIENQRILLKKRIKDEVLRREIEKRAIAPPEELVEREVNTYADQQWRLLFPNPEKKKEVLSRMQLTGLKILEGLKIWRQDNKTGDEFAKNELEPLGMNKQAWSFYTDHSQDPEILGKLEKWEDIDTMSEDEIKEFLFLTNNQDHRNNIRFFLAKEMLKKSVTPKTSPTQEEVQRLFDLIYNTQWIEIIIIPGDDEELVKLSGTEKKDRNSVLSKKLQSKTIRLPRSDSKDPGRKASHLKEFMVLAAYTDSLKPGTLSSAIQWPDQGDFVIYIVDRKAKDEIGDSSEQHSAQLTDALRRFKRGQAFEHWLNKEIPLRTHILIPEYKEALRN